jgi:chromosome segregation ATPase
MIELPKLKADIDFLQLEIQSLKAELQATNDDLTTTRKTAIEAQARVEYVETGADVSQTEIQVIKAEINRMKEYLVTVERVANNLPLIELMWVKENYTRLRQILKLFGR